MLLLSAHTELLVNVKTFLCIITLEANKIWCFPTFQGCCEVANAAEATHQK